MTITVQRIDDAYKMEATNETGETILMDGSKSLGASESAFRPMQVLLTSLAGCTSIDVINMLNKMRQRLDDFKVIVTSERTGGIPSPFTKINLHFVFKGNIKEQKIESALEKSHTKYCSVYFSLNPNIDITNTYELEYVE